MRGVRAAEEVLAAEPPPENLLQVLNIKQLETAVSYACSIYLLSLFFLLCFYLSSSLYLYFVGLSLSLF